jgi:hypothetical protein
MADIDIVPKRRSSTWMWVLLAAIIVALIVWMMAGSADVPSSGANLPGARVPAATSNAVQNATAV